MVNAAAYYGDGVVCSMQQYLSHCNRTRGPIMPQNPNSPYAMQKIERFYCDLDHQPSPSSSYSARTT